MKRRQFRAVVGLAFTVIFSALAASTPVEASSQPGSFARYQPNCGSFTPCYPPSSPGPGIHPVWPSRSCQPTNGGWHICTIHSSGRLPLYDGSWSANFPHGSFHAPSIPGWGFWQQGLRLAHSVSAGQTYFAAFGTGPASGCLFLLVNFPTQKINTGFPGAFSTSSSPRAPRYSILGPGNEVVRTQGWAWAKSSGSGSCPP